MSPCAYYAIIPFFKNQLSVLGFQATKKEEILKKTIVTFMLISIVSMYGFAKSVMDQQLQEKIIQDINQSLYGVIIADGIRASSRTFCPIIVKNAGESKVLWDQCPGVKYCDRTLEKGVPVLIQKAEPKKWGFQITFRTVERIRYAALTGYWEKIKKNGKWIEIERQKRVKKNEYFLFRIDFKFNEKYHANTPENIQFIHDTFAQGFVFFKSQEDALVYMDKEFGSKKAVEIGMPVEDVIARLGLPDKKIRFKNKMVYRYPDWILKFEDGKVIDVKF